MAMVSKGGRPPSQPVAMVKVLLRPQHDLSDTHGVLDPGSLSWMRFLGFAWVTPPDWRYRFIRAAAFGLGVPTRWEKCCARSLGERQRGLG